MIFIIWLFSLWFGSVGFSLIASSFMEEFAMGLSDQDKKCNFIKGIFFISISFILFYATVVSFI
jgi:hypothetical protein